MFLLLMHIPPKILELTKSRIEISFINSILTSVYFSFKSNDNPGLLIYTTYNNQLRNLSKYHF